MKNIAGLILGLALTGLATTGNASKDHVKHIVTLNGLNQGDGRLIRTDIIENGQYKSGYYFCGTRHSIVFGQEVYASEVDESYHADWSIKFSICQDETLTHCQEFATDQFTIFKNKEGHLETDSRPVLPLSIASVKDAFNPCEPTSEMPETTKRIRNISAHKA